MKEQKQVTRMDSTSESTQHVDAGNNEPAPATVSDNQVSNEPCHVWASPKYGWVARVLHEGGGVSFWACDTKAEALEVVAQGALAI
jgi:hypothetical protein